MGAVIKRVSVANYRWVDSPPMSGPLVGRDRDEWYKDRNPT